MSLEVEKISKRYEGRTVVDAVSFSVKKGEIVGVLGPNGAGKTTSFYMAVGLIYPDAGRVLLDGKDISSLPLHRRAQLGISYLPQNASIFRGLSVKDNILGVMELARIPRYTREERCLELMERFKVSHLQNSIGATLSGGERRRVELARALVSVPQYLLLDEPFAGVDPVTVQEIQEMISDLRTGGMGVLVTDHNVRETLGICDRSYVLSRGQVVEQGDAAAIANSSLVRRVYLGEKFRL